MTAAWVDPNFSVTNPIKSINIQREDARVAYTDPTAFSLRGSSTGTVVLHLNVKTSRPPLATRPGTTSRAMCGTPRFS